MEDVPTRLATAEETIANLEAALATNRVIGVATGVLVERFGLTSDEAFSCLVRVSSRTNRKVRDVAVILLETGQLPDVKEVGPHGGH